MQLVGVAAAFAAVFTSSIVTFGAIKAVFGLRVSEEDEDAGLDITEHGMYGYPEQFIPAAELAGYGALPARPPRRAPPTRRSQEVTRDMKMVIGIRPARGVRADPHGAAGRSGSPR